MNNMNTVDRYKLAKASLNQLSIQGKSEELRLFIQDHSFGNDLLNCVVRRPEGLREKEAEEWSRRNWGASNAKEVTIKAMASGIIITFMTDTPPIQWVKKLRCCYTNLEFELTTN